MPRSSSIDARSSVFSTTLSLILISGCGAQDSPPANTGTPAPPAKGAAPVLKDINRDLENIKKDITPPVIIKPDQQPAPKASPGKSG
jgi:hypothetical protein